MEFGDFMKVASTFGLFGKEQILRSLFMFADYDKVGYITTEQFTDLLNVLNPYEKRRAKKAMLNLALEPRKMISYPEFEHMYNQFPNILHTAFELQASLRENTMGNEWWLNKLRKYKGVREKLTEKDSITDKLRALEIERFKEDEAKAERLAKRAQAIKTTNSAVRKTILEAQQFLDELS
jgi:hypothetical protein